MGKVEEEPAAGAPDWIVTFADMISLLVTFFILLLTFSSMEDMDGFQVQGSLTGPTGTLAEVSGDSSLPPPPVDKMLAMDATRGAQLPHSRPTKELLDSVSDTGMKAGSEHKEVDLSAVGDGMLIRYDDRASFEPGSATLTPWMEKSVAELARTLEHYPHIIVLEGNTDTNFRPTKAYPTAEKLTAEMCFSVKKVMLENSNLSPLQLQFAANGSSHPISEGSNDTAEGRRSNRRVDLRIMSNSKARARALEQRDATDG
jgi:chemotaxis protein MotB